MEITPTKFQQTVGRYQYAAFQRPVTISNNGRPDTRLISANLFDLLPKGRVARKIEDLDDEGMAAKIDHPPSLLQGG